MNHFFLVLALPVCMYASISNLITSCVLIERLVRIKILKYPFSLGIVCTVFDNASNTFCTCACYCI